uniref:Uncharacterized protein n=1 Tax=Siphoviridae sp. ctfbh2 TaxID=2827909 RepID=A0A8S5T3Q8_9CAUD|nr:MAG TPA: hypothetical protein [Siphoviridae sp. ctfbh2]DAL80426.1 MAG TPA: hypothetical protein [Caudoviricetes sp.]DAZ41884.1 MAG TPA: hypothetical protein [Caudoviricetes sp.]
MWIFFWLCPFRPYRSERVINTIIRLGKSY